MTRRNRFEDLLRLYGNRPRVEPPPKWTEDERDWIDGDADADRMQEGKGLAAGPPPRRPYTPPLRPFHWKEHLESLRYSLESTGVEHALSWRPGREILYVIDIAGTLSQGGLILDVCYRDPRKRGGWTQVRRLNLERRQLRALPDPDDRRLLALLAGGRDPDRLWMESYPTYGGAGSRYLIPADLYLSLLPLLCATGRCHLRAAVTDVEPLPLSWDDGSPWTFSLDVRSKPGSAHYLATGCLRRGSERLDLSAPKLIVGGGLVFTDERVARLDDGGAFPWIAHLS